MTLDVDFLIDFFKKYSTTGLKGEMGEQEASSAPASPSSGGGGNVPKWSDSYNITRGKANRLGASGKNGKQDLQEELPIKFGN